MSAGWTIRLSLSEPVSHSAAGKGEDIDCKVVNPSAGVCNELQEDAWQEEDWNHTGILLAISHVSLITIFTPSSLMLY